MSKEKRTVGLGCSIVVAVVYCNGVLQQCVAGSVLKLQNCAAVDRQV